MVILAMLVPRKSLVPITFGVLIGIVSAYVAPDWQAARDEIRLIEGRVSQSGFRNGNYEVVLRDYTIDSHRCRGKILLKQFSGVSPFSTGTVIRAECLLKKPKGNGNSSDFDYKKYLIRNGITAYGYIRNYQIISSGRNCSSRERIKAYLRGLGRPEAEILTALLTGDRGGLTHAQRDLFNSLGISHLLAISGLHMGLVMLLGYTLTFSILRLVPVFNIKLDTPLVAKITGVVTVCVFFAFIDKSLPSVRAVIMAVIMVSSFFIMRKTDLVESLSLAGVIILAVWPFSIYTPGFLLSFSATLGIILTAERFRFKSPALKLVAVSMAAFVFTFPIVINLFGYFSPWSLPANLIAVPFFSFIIMPLSLSGLLSFPFWENFSEICLGMAMEGIAIFFELGHAIGKFSIFPHMGRFWGMLFFLLLLILLMAKKTIIKPIATLSLAGCLFLIPLIQCPRVADSGLTFDFINTGYGDCLLVTCRDFAMLVDAGGTNRWDTGRFIVTNHLRSRGITKLDIVAVTNPGNAHVGGLPFIVERFGVGEIWVSRDDYGPSRFKDVIRIAHMKSIPIKKVSLGDTLNKKFISIEVLNPPKKQTAASKNLGTNLHSMVLRIGDDSMKVLYMSECSGIGELSVAHLDRSIDSAILASANAPQSQSNLDAFIDRVRPEYAFVNKPETNPAALDRLISNGVKSIHRSNGAILGTAHKGRVDLKSPGRVVDSCYEVYAQKTRDQRGLLHVE